MKYGITMFMNNTISMVMYGTIKKLIQKNQMMLTTAKVKEEVKSIYFLVDIFNKVSLYKRQFIPENPFTNYITFRVSTEEDIEYAKKHKCFVDYSKLKEFEENQEVYYITYCYHKDETYPTPDVFCYCWHENLRKCFNEELLFANKEDAIAKCNELRLSLLYKVDKK